MSLKTHKNELIKRRFYDYLENSKGFSKETIGCYEKAIWRWQEFTNLVYFSIF